MIDFARLQLPSAITWRENAKFKGLYEAVIAEQMVAWIEPRPAYCDRGHFKMHADLPDLDGADSFPRYYMRLAVAKAETEAFLRWRLWRVRQTEIDPAREALLTLQDWFGGTATPQGWVYPHGTREMRAVIAAALAASETKQ